MVLFAAPVFGQSGQEQQWPSVLQSRYPQQSDGPQGQQSSMPDANVGDPTLALASMEGMSGMLPLMPIDNSRLIDDESCQGWTQAAVNSPTVSVVRLAIPGKARHQFQEACGDFKDRRLGKAEIHARSAVKIYPEYAAAWVLLGQVLESDHKDNEAVKACSRGWSADPRYAAPYMCLAQFAARVNDWDAAYTLADHALSLDPAADPYAFLYTATADFHLKRYDQAELYGLSAEKLDKWNKIPEVHLLLARIYEVERKPGDEAQELRRFVKSARHDAAWEVARVRLGQLRGQ